MIAYPLEWSLAILYVLLGPGSWLFLGFVSIKGRSRMTLLTRPIEALPAHAPSVAVLVPVKDEGAQVRECLSSILRQEYAGDWRVVAIDDRSTDDTGPVLDAMALENDRLRVLHVMPGTLPPGWAGKCHALHVAVPTTSSDWLLFVDSDVKLTPDVLAATIAVAELREFDLLSLLPQLTANSFWERLLVPLGGLATSAMYTLPLTNYNEVPSVAFANGQYLAIRRSAYDAIGGHAAVRQYLSEDVAIARKLKRAGFRPRISVGTEFASTRMYDSLGGIVRGWSRNFLAGSDGRPWRMLGAIAFTLFCCLSMYPAFAWGVYRNFHPVNILAGWGWIATSLLHFIICTLTLGQFYVWSGNTRKYALAFPLGALAMIAIWLRAIQLSLKGKVEWRGTTYNFKVGYGVDDGAA